MLKELSASAIPGIAAPSPTPMNMAKKIQRVRYLFRKESFFNTFSAVCSSLQPT
jgi:hypothetical protein